MKSGSKSKLIRLMLILLGILFALLPIINNCFNFNDSRSIYSESHNLTNENLKISAVSGKIHINNNWSDAKTAGIVTGEGTYSNPYIIKDFVIDGGNSAYGILIENSNEYFKIENCTVYNTSVFTRSLSYIEGAGINLQSVSNGVLINNNVSNNYKNGIYLSGSNNTMISGNIVNNYNLYGIHLRYSNNTMISGNTVNNNSYGIYLDASNRNTVSANTVNNNFIGMYIWNSNNTIISGNTVNNNNEDGLHLRYSDYTTISANTINNNLYGIMLYASNYTNVFGNSLIGNDVCIYETDSHGNVFENNNCNEGDAISFELIILISLVSGGTVISVVTILLIRRTLKGKLKVS